MAATEEPEADPPILATPVEPSLGRTTAIVRQELVDFLRADQSRLGEVFRGVERGLSADQIAAELGVGTSNFVWNYQRTIKTILHANLPRAPTVALQTARRVRTTSSKDIFRAVLALISKACLRTLSNEQTMKPLELWRLRGRNS